MTNYVFMIEYVIITNIILPSELWSGGPSSSILCASSRHHARRRASDASRCAVVITPNPPTNIFPTNIA